ncbi:MAG: glycoside hydrolase family 31 protein [Eubacteriales bacterium]
MLTAQKRRQTTVKKTIKTESALILETGNGSIRIEPYSDEILRITYTLKEEFSDIQGLGTLPKSDVCRWTYKEEESSVTLSLKKMILVIDKNTGSFTYYDGQSRLLTKEPDRGGKELEPFDAYKTILDENSVLEKVTTPDGIKEVVREAKKVFYKTLYHTRLEFEWSEGEALYGLGQNEEGILNLREKRQYVHQANMKIAMPVLISTRGYGILFDTYSPLIFNDNEYGSYIYNEAANELDYYFIVGENFDGIISGYRSLTGQAAMLPKWAFGYMQSQERYESEQEILDTVSEYRRRQLPLDSIVLDWQSWEEGMWGQKSFDTSRFPDANRMTNALHAMDTRFMISIWPNMHKNTADYAEMKKENCLFRQSEIYNAFDEKARKLYWKQADEGLFSRGIDAWWCDSSEPVTPEWNTRMKPEPDHNYLAFHHAARVYIDEEYTNAYPLMHAKAIWDGQRSSSDEKRVVNLTRSGYTGQQKYGTILWSGDTSAKWQTLKNQIPAGLDFCASGIPYWTLDIGAFFVKKGSMWFWDGDYEEGCDDLGYRELYTRWFQLGVFLPVFRSHGTDTRREIWRFGEKGDIFYDTLAKFDALRYQLLPYIYSMAGMVTLKDYTIMRLLAFDFIGDPKVYDIKDQYMFGSSLMICPVTNPMYYGINSVPLAGVDKTREVYLPAGADWYDFWTREKYSGGQTITANAPLDILPVYVKAGSVVPMAETAQHSGASSESEIKLVIWPGADGAFTLYQDEKDNYNYEKGAYTTIELSWKDDSGTLKIGKRSGSFAGMPESIAFTVEIIGKGSESIVYHGDEVE